MLSRNSCIHPSTQLETNLPKGIETVFEGQFRDELYGFFNLVVWCTQGAKIENVKDVEADGETEIKKVENVKDVKSKGLSNKPTREDPSIESGRKQSYEF